MRGLDGKVVVVTGGAQGIGFATASRFLEEGARVLIGDVSRDTLEEASVALQSRFGDHVHALYLDVTDTKSVCTAFQCVESLCGGFDILINNAGITDDRLIDNMTDAGYRRVIDVNQTGTFLCSREAVRLLKEHGSAGAIISAASIIADKGNVGQVNYAMSKGAIVSFTRTLAAEVARYGIRVNAVAPGFVRTSMTGEIPDAYKQAITATIPMGRFGDPEEIASMYAFLASDEASYVTGQVFSVNGGLGSILTHARE